MPNGWFERVRVTLWGGAAPWRGIAASPATEGDLATHREIEDSTPVGAGHAFHTGPEAAHTRDTMEARPRAATTTTGDW